MTASASPRARRIAIGVDNKWRDLPGYSYLRLLLERQFGCEVRLFREGCERRVIFDWKPDVVVLNHLMSMKRAKWLAPLHKRGLRIALLPTEGIPTLSGYQRIVAGAFTDLSIVDLQFAWGPKYAEMIANEGRVAADRVRVIGVPRFDFYSPALAPLVAPRGEFLARHGLSPARKTILWTTNFTQAGMYRKREEFMIRDWTNLGITRVDQFKDPIDLARRDFFSREAALECLRALLVEFPEVNVMLKPHPNEEHAYYAELERELREAAPGRFALLINEYIWDALGVCDLVMQRSCTTGIEAWFAGLPTVEMQIYPEEFYFSEKHAAGSVIARAPEEARAFVRRLLADPAMPEEVQTYRRKFIREWCVAIDGRRTLECARELAELAASAPGFSIPWASAAHAAEAALARVARARGRKEYEPAFKPLARAAEFDHLGRRDKWITAADLEAWARRIEPHAAALLASAAEAPAASSA